MSNTNEITKIVQRALQEPGPLLIVTLREPLSYLTGLAILLERARNSKLTHLASVDTILSPIVDDLTQHYDNILIVNALEEADKRTLEKFHKKNIHKLIIREISDIREIEHSLMSDTAKLFCELSVCLLYYEYDVKEYSFRYLRQTEHPPLPGIAYLSLDLSLKNMVIPAPLLLKDLAIPSKSLREITQEEFLSILINIAKKIYENKQALAVLDVLCKRDYVTPMGTSVVDYLTVLETMFGLEVYIASPLDLVTRSQILASSQARNFVEKYADKIRELLTEGGEIDNITMFYRLCIYRVAARQKLENLNLRTRDGIICMPFAENVDLSSFKTYDVQRVRPNLKVVCYEAR